MSAPNDGIEPAAPQDHARAKRAVGEARRQLVAIARTQYQRRRSGADTASTPETKLIDSAVAQLMQAERALQSAPPDMLDEIGERALSQVLLRCTGRTPAAGELARWRDMMRENPGAAHVLRQLTETPAFIANRGVKIKNPPGHFFSPIVDPETVIGFIAAQRQLRPHQIAGIEFDLHAMAQFWQRHAAFTATCPFPAQPDGTHRFAFDNGAYNPGDAIMLRTMIAAHRPGRIVEIGSGYSTGCMLDTVDEAGLTDLRITCIEPHPARLHTILRQGDASRVSILQQPVQETGLDLFRALGPDDILFIDSTHVLKTGSDVHFELFEILPVLRPGVLVHIHDCGWPFEYSDTQIFEKNYSWNEAYAVRALLMDSSRFKVEFYNSLFAREHRAAVEPISPAFLADPGTSLWLRIRP